MGTDCNGISSFFIPKNIAYKMGVNPIKYINKLKSTTI